VAGVTTSGIELLNEPDAAVMIVTPPLLLLANPELLIVAMLDWDEVHMADDVRFCVLPSLYVAVSANCSALPTTTVGLAGVIVIELRVGVGAVTVVDE
jgi:hypothetical protein